LTVDLHNPASTEPATSSPASCFGTEAGVPGRALAAPSSSVGGTSHERSCHDRNRDPRPHDRANALGRRQQRDVRRVRRQDVFGPADRARPVRPVRRLVRRRPDGTTIELTIDADSLDTGNATRDKHLRSADFFHSGAHPQVRFTSTRVHHVTGEVLHVVGHLEAAGNVVELEFPAFVWQFGDALEIEATTTIDPRRLGMSTGRLGMIRPSATLRVRARLTRRPLGIAMGGNRWN
jgi:YceI-like domain